MLWGPIPAIFRALIERCPMVTYVADAAGAITYISPQIEDWTGLPGAPVDRGPDVLARR